MTCPHDKSSVIESRSSPSGVRRRRECDRCAYRWTTVEILLDDYVQLVEQANAEATLGRRMLRVLQDAGLVTMDDE